MDAVLCNSSPLFGSLHRPAPSVSNRLWFPDPPSASTSRLLFKSSFLTQRKPPRSSSLTHSAIDRLTIKCGAIKEIKEAEFPTTVLKSERPVLVEFVATWCGPCRLISPAMESIAQEYGDRLGVVKIDHDKSPQLIEEYKVYGLPTLILFKNGQEVPGSRREGAISKVKLQEYVDTLLETLSIA